MPKIAAYDNVVYSRSLSAPKSRILSVWAHLVYGLGQSQAADPFLVISSPT